MRLRSVSSGFFTGIPSLRCTTRLLPTLYEENQIDALNSFKNMVKILKNKKIIVDKGIDFCYSVRASYFHLGFECTKSSEPGDCRLMTAILLSR